LRIAPNNANVGSYQVKIRATDSRGGTGETPSFTITVNNIGGAPANSPPVAVANSLATPIEATGPSGAIVTLNGSASSDPDGDPLTYQWTDNGIGFATTASATRTLGLGTHTIALTVSDGRGHTTTTSQIVLVRDTTSPAITVSPGAVTFTQGQTVVLPTPTVSDAVDASVTVTNNAPASYPVGTTVVTFTATDDAGNSATATVSVTISPAGPVSPTLTSISPNAGTQGSTFTMTLNGSNFQPGATVSFSGGGITATVTSNTGSRIIATVTIAANAVTGSGLNARSVTVTNPGGGAASLSRIFSVLRR
jgi:hypothetical protein